MSPPAPIRRLPLVEMASPGHESLSPLLAKLRARLLGQLEKYVAERGNRERFLFQLAQDNHAVLEGEFLREYERLSDTDPQADFDALFTRCHDGVIRNSPQGFDIARQAGVYIDRNVEITAEIRRRVMILYDLCCRFGLA